MAEELRTAEGIRVQLLFREGLRLAEHKRTAGSAA